MDERDKSTQAEVEPANESVDVGKPSSTVEIETDILSQHKTLASQVGQGNSNNSSGTLGDGSEQMKIFVTNANVTYHTRHARRIYVGGIPPNYSDEEELRNFFNKVISKGLGVENDHSFVISVYMNQKKCYAFVEFSSIELTTACLEMDGIIFKKVTLKIYRANEYRPDLVPPAKFLKLDLSGWSFGLATGAGAPGSVNGTNPALNNPNYPRPNSQSGISPTSSWVAEEPPSPVQLNDCIASLIQFTNIASMEPGSLAIVGFPYESGTAKPHARTPQRGVGTSACPACLRKSLTTYAGAMIYNAELGLDLSLQPIMDVGDVLAGQSRNETKALLSTTISELLLRGSVPFLVGGSRDQTYYSAMGLVAATGVCVGVMNVSAQVDGKILDCPEFCTPTSLMQGAGRANNVSPTRSQNCYGRYVQFGAQGAQCNGEIAKSIVDRGGHIFWLHKDLRNASTESIAVAQFNRALRNLDACVLHDQQRKGLNTAALRNAYPQAFIMVSVDCGVLAGMFNPLAGSSCSSLGLTAEEVLEIAYIAGAHPNVALFEITEFRPDMDSESRMNMFLADVFYKFALGVASRTQPLRGGALGAGAVALTSGVSSVAISPTAGAVPVPGGVQAQYGGRTPTAAAANLKRGPGVGGVGGGYTPSRDPAIILQQQQQQQQQQYQQQMLQQQAQPPVPGRIPYTPQQLQIQQQHLQQQQQLAMMNRTNQAAQLQQPLQQPPQQRGGVPAFPSGVSEAGLNAQNGNRGFAPTAQRGSLTQSPNLNGSYYHLDDALSVTSGGNDFSLNGSLHSLQLSQPSQAQPQHAPAQNGYQTGTRAATNYGNAFAEEDASYARGLNHRPSPIVTQTASNNALDSAGSASSLFGHAASNNNSFYRSQQGNGSLLNPSAPTFQSDNKWSNYGVSSASAGTPASQATHSTAVPSFPSGADWMAAQGDSSRYSAFTNSTSSLTLGNPSTSFHHAHSQHSTPHHAPSVFAAQSNGHNHNYSNSTGSSSLRGHSSLPELTGPYEDAMDKLIGVTNIGHIPSFDDPHDPQYQED